MSKKLEKLLRDAEELEALVGVDAELLDLAANKTTIDTLYEGTLGEGLAKKFALGFYDFANVKSVVVASSTGVNVTTNVLTKTAHGLVTGDTVIVSTSDTLPTGLSADTAYYVIRVTADTFKVATTRANALAGTAIDITGAGAGNQTFKSNVLGDISLGVTLPDKTVITRTFYKVITTFTDGGDDNTTIALQLNSANDVKTATAISAGGNIWDAGGFVAGVQDDAVGNFLQLTAERELIMAVAVDDITAGKIEVGVEYFQGQ